MDAIQPTTNLIPKENLPSMRSRGKKALRIALIAFGSIIVLAAVFFILFVHTRPAPAQVLQDLKASSSSAQPVQKQKDMLDTLGQQSKPSVPPDDARALLQQLSK